MAGTLIVSLAGLKLASLQQVVTARAIDTVLVVDTPQGFATGGIAGVSSAAALRTTRNQGLQLKAAFAGGEPTAQLSPAVYQSLSNAGFTFVNDPGLDSFLGAFVLDQAAVQGSGASAVIRDLDNGGQGRLASLVPGDLSSAPLVLYSPTGSVVGLTSSTGSAVSLSLGDGFSSSNVLTDFKGTVRVNLSAAQFTELAHRSGLASDNPKKLALEVLNPANLLVDANSLKLPSFVDAANSGSLTTDGPVRGSWYGGQYQDLTPQEVTDKASSGKRFGNLDTVSQGQDTVGGFVNNYFWKSDGDLSAIAARALPLMGVAEHSDSSYGTLVRLVDTAANLSWVLPQLTPGQLASFGTIVVSDNQPLLLDAKTLKAIDVADQTAFWSVHNGDSIVNINNSPAQIKLAGTLTSLKDAGIVDSSNHLVAQVDGGIGPNLLAQVSVIQLDLNGISPNSAERELKSTSSIVEFSNSLISRAASWSVSDFRIFVQDGVDILGEGGIRIVDTPANIKSILLDENLDIHSALDSIVGFSSINSPAAIELTWDQYQSLELDSPSLFNSLGNIELIVSGTAAELQALFDEFGTDFAGLKNSISFRVTDGGEVTVNAAQLDKLDGRLTGAVVVLDDSLGIANLLDGAVPGTVKDIELLPQINAFESNVNSFDSPPSYLDLTVNQFRNLPAFANQQVRIVDSEINIVRALSYGTLDDRVVELRLVDDNLSDGGLTLNAATAAKLGDYRISSVNGDDNLIILDRGAAIANYIEGASFPDGAGLKLEFVESSGNSIYLNADQELALNDLVASL